MRQTEPARRLDGKVLSDYTKEQILAEYAMTGNVSHVARKYKSDDRTIRKVLQEKRDEFMEIREDMKVQMVKEIWGQMDSVMKLGKKMIDEALEDKRQIPLNHISSYIGTMYDKQALMMDENTQNVGGNGIQVVLGLPDVEDEGTWNEKADEDKDKEPSE